MCLSTVTLTVWTGRGENKTPSIKYEIDMQSCHVKVKVKSSQVKSSQVKLS